MTTARTRRESLVERVAGPLRASPQQRTVLRHRVLALVSWLNLVVPKMPTKTVVHSVPDLEDGAVAVLEALQARGHAPIVLAEDAGTAARGARLLGRPVRVVPKLSVRGLLHYLTAGHVITTHGLYPTRRLPRSQVLVNVWHGEPLTKPVGRWEGRSAVPATVSTSLSSLGKAFRCAEFDLHPAQVHVLGAPRNDRLLRTDRAQVRAALGLDPGTTVFWWLPTYRVAVRRQARADGEAYPGGIPLDRDGLGQLDAFLAERGAVLYVKSHPLSSPLGAFDGSGHIRAVDEGFLHRHALTLYNLLQSADCLITDVSSVWIDFLLVDRPLIFMFPDVEKYRADRGLHLEPYDVWVPGPTPTTGVELTAEMAKVIAGRDEHAAARLDARRRLHRHLDQRSTERLLDVLGL